MATISAGRGRAPGSSVRFRTTVGVLPHGGDDAQFGIGQRVKTIQPDVRNAAQALAGDPLGGEFQAPGAEGHAAIAQFAIHLAVDGQKRGGERGLGQFLRQAPAVASRRGEFADGARQRGAEAAHVDHARELGPVHAARGLFHNQVERRIGHLRDIAGPVLHEAGESLDEAVRKHKTLARQPVFQVLREGGGGHQQAHGVSTGPQRMPQFIEDIVHAVHWPAIHACSVPPSRSTFHRDFSRAYCAS